MTHETTSTLEQSGRAADQSWPCSDILRFLHPDDLLADPDLSRAQKRAILASWLSDARAVENVPALRQLDSGALVKVDDLVHALSALDAIQDAADTFRRGPSFPRHRPDGRMFERLRRVTRRNGPDDDDPPPCPVGARPRRHGPTSGSAAEQVDTLALALA